MTSKWIQSAPAARTAFTSSPKRAKSADKIDAEIIAAIVIPSSHAARRAYPFVGFLDALSFFLRHLRHRLRQAVGHEFIRMMPAHLTPVGLGYFLIGDTRLDFELRIALGQRPGTRCGSPAGGCTARLLPRPQRCFHVRKFEARH